MPTSGTWLRVFVALLLAVLPPILMVVGALLLTESVLRAAEPNLVAVLVVIGACGWAAILAVVYARSLNDDFRSLLSLAARGPGDREGEGTAYRQIAVALDERNRQVATLAEQAAAVAIDDPPQRVATGLVAAVRSVTRDPTWRLAILSSSSELLQRGVYVADTDASGPDAIGNLEEWTAVTGSGAVRHVAGPWGAFAVVDLAGTEATRGVFYAPWAGRGELTPAESALLKLVGQQAGTALEHSLLYARVRAQADELDRLASLQADFLRGVTHDLQTPLTSIGALATELRANAHVPEEARADLDTITHQAERLRRMVSQLLVASRLEAGAFVPQQEVFALAPVVERAWKALRADRPWTLEVRGAPHLAVADPDRVEQVVWALLDNAVKYSPPGSPIAASISPLEDYLAVTIRDRGVGMDDETRERAFEQFYRSESARRLAPDGSGVGLYAAAGVMRAMGGRIDVQSSLGGGTAMTILVPSEPSEPGTD